MSNATPTASEPLAHSTGSALGRIEHFKFDLTDKVFITEIQRPGVVESLTVDFLGPQYRVAYWDNGERKTAWVQASKITHKTEKTKP